MGMTNKLEKDWVGLASHEPQEIEDTHQFSSQLKGHSRRSRIKASDAFGV